MTRHPLGLFAGVGVELEYMLVDAETLSVLPAADKVLRVVAGEYVTDVEHGPVSWSNELALHVIELKTTGPIPTLTGFAEKFQDSVRHVNRLLEPLGGRLMPTAMHPWMDPYREMRLWPHEYNAVYEAFDRIFGCRGHGWANLQSVHVNLPFAGDEEFGRLHAAIRLLLPILPALSASSPVMDGRLTGLLDNRLEVYRQNAARVPSVSGQVIPEPAYTRADYEKTILQRIYADISPYDPDSVLRHEWLNARGAIARFDRDTIEIRVLDVQECPRADLAICAAIVAALRLLTGGLLSPPRAQAEYPTEELHRLFLACLKDAEQTPVDLPDYRDLLSYHSAPPCTAGELWRHLLARAEAESQCPAEEFGPTLQTILARGPLARRIARALGAEPSSERLRAVYAELCECLQEGKLFG